VRARLRADLHAPATARLFVRDLLDTLLDGDRESLRDDVVLIISELVTNSVQSGAADIELEVQADAQRVDVRVTDDGPGWPLTRTATVDDLGGRGLDIIEKLTDTWCITAHGLGKTVTATWFRHLSGP
jgi:anti-sigma regulatory factor (Ser/Thr protein kinase)